MSDAPQTPENPYNAPSNRKKGKDGFAPKPEKFEKIIQGEAVQKKKPLGKRIMESMTGDDTRSVGNYVFFDVILPAIKSLIVDAANSGLERMFFGESAGRGPRRGVTNYNGYSKPTVISSGGRPQNVIANRPDPRAVHDFDNIQLTDRGSADQVIDMLAEMCSQYGSATVADLYQLVGVTGNYQDDKWGWTSMVGARSERLHNGYYALVLPKSIPMID